MAYTVVSCAQERPGLWTPPHWSLVRGLCLAVWFPWHCSLQPTPSRKGLMVNECLLTALLKSVETGHYLKGNLNRILFPSHHSPQICQLVKIVTKLSSSHVPSKASIQLLSTLLHHSCSYVLKCFSLLLQFRGQSLDRQFYYKLDHNTWHGRPQKTK